MKYIPTIITVLLLVLPLPSCLPSDADIEWDILNQEAVDLYAKGQYGRAVIVAKKALEIAEKNIGPHHLDVAMSLNNLAEVYRATERDTEAAMLEQRTARIEAIQR